VVSDPSLESAARLLGRRAIGEIVTVPLARMDDHEPAHPRLAQYALGRWHGPAEQRHVVAQRLAEPAGIDEIALEVDHQERGRRRLERERVRLRLDVWHGHSPLPPPSPRKKVGVRADSVVAADGTAARSPGAGGHDAYSTLFHPEGLRRPT